MSEDVFSFIREDLNILERELGLAVQTKLPLITDVATHIVESGGKRLRPALCLMSAQAGKSYQREHVIPLAIAMEMVHMASLMHDDVIDESHMRRGVETVNARWGNRIAILSGDYMFAHAFQVVEKEHYGETVATKVANLICELTVGEITQDALLFQGNDDIDEYYHHIEKKTAQFLAVCCELGAMISGADKVTCEALRLYGLYLGMAFQITDDILDIAENEEAIGKPVGNDIRQGVMTLPVIYALKNSKAKMELLQIVINEKMSDEMLERALEIVRASGGIDYAREEARRFLKSAFDAIEGVLSEQLASEMRKVAEFICIRNF